jgi:hypothetical protein
MSRRLAIASLAITVTVWLGFLVLSLIPDRGDVEGISYTLAALGGVLAPALALVAIFIAPSDRIRVLAASALAATLPIFVLAVVFAASYE